MRPTSDSSAVRSSASDLLLPWNTMRAGGNPARTRDVQLAAGGDVEVEPVLGDQLRHRRAEERLARVRHRVGAEGVGVLAAARPQLALVVDVQRRAEAWRARPATSHPPTCRRPSATVALRGSRRRSSGAPVIGSSAIGASALTIRLVGDARHLVGRVDAEDRERVGEADPARLGQPQPGLRERGVVGDDPAVAVEAVEGLGEVAHPRGDAVRVRAVRPPPPRHPGYASSARSSSSSRSCTSGASDVSRTGRRWMPSSAAFRPIDAIRAYAYCT